jgi:hypothetical protein
MSSFWESKYLSSEKSVQFLQQTHAEILKGLHDEIESLQKQCSGKLIRMDVARHAPKKPEGLGLGFGFQYFWYLVIWVWVWVFCKSFANFE